MSSSKPTKFERDIELVQLFLSEYKDAEGNSYHISARPDKTERSAKAIEALAVDEHGHSLAVEHTMVEAFEGKKADDIPFFVVFEQLGSDSSLVLPNRLVDIQCPALAIPKGLDWKDIRQKVTEWFNEIRNDLPADGYGEYAIPELGFELKVNVETINLPDTFGAVIASRVLPEGKPFIDVLRRALANKVPKLVETRADRHILLLEDEGAGIGFYKVIHGLDSSMKETPRLKEVDEVWVVKTMSWQTSGTLFFYYVWPDGVKNRFRVLDGRFAKKDEFKPRESVD